MQCADGVPLVNGSRPGLLCVMKTVGVRMTVSGVLDSAHPEAGREDSSPVRPDRSASARPPSCRGSRSPVGDPKRDEGESRGQQPLFAGCVNPACRRAVAGLLFVKRPNREVLDGSPFGDTSEGIVPFGSDAGWLFDGQKKSDRAAAPLACVVLPMRLSGSLGQGSDEGYNSPSPQVSVSRVRSEPQLRTRPATSSDASIRALRAKTRPIFRGEVEWSKQTCPATGCRRRKRTLGPASKS